MRLVRGPCWWSLLAALGGASWCAAASIDFTIGVDLPSLYNRFGVDLQGNILIAANPAACTLPTMKPLYACGPIWVGKLDPMGKNLLFGTYLGNGSLADGIAMNGFTSVAGIAADANGNIIVAAHTTQQDLPTVNAFQASPTSKFTNLYVAKIASDGSRLMYATYLGGSGGQTALSLALDSAGSAYVAASVNSTDFPTTPQSFRAAGLYQTGVAKLDASGKLQYAAVFPFEFYTAVRPIQVDTTGQAVLASNLEALTVAPDGSSLIRATYPTWVTIPGPCDIDSSSFIWCPEPPWALPRLGGGFQFAGVASTGVPVTADALQISGESNSHLLITGGQEVLTPLPMSATGLAVDPKNQSRIYAATPTGLFLSQDNGFTWNLLHTGPCLAIAVDPFDSNRLYLSLDAVPSVDVYPRIYRSTDSGVTWTAVYGGPNQEERILSLAADPNVQGLLYGAGTALDRSKDGGDTWDSQFVGPSMANMSPSAATSTKSQFVQVDPTHAGWAYVIGFTNCIGFCGNYQNLSRTEDGGNTWSSTTAGPDPSVSQNANVMLAVDPNSGDVIYPANGIATIYRNGDFTKPQVLYAAQTTGAAFDPANPGTIYLAVQVSKGAGSGYFIVKSVDDGVSWTAVLQLDRPAYNLAVSANGVLQASQTPNPPQTYFLTSTPVGNVSYGTYFGEAFTLVNSMEGSGTNAVVGGTTAGEVPVLDAVQPASGGGRDGFVTVFGDDGAVLWSTYLGGSADDSVDWVLPVGDGSVVVVGTTNSADFPGLQPSPLGSVKSATFIMRLRP